MAKNTTIDRKIVKKKGNDHSPERGFDLVIFKNHKFDRVVPNGQKANKGLLDRFHTYEVYAVSKDPNHTLSFRSSLMHNDNVHEFHIDYEVIFSVSDPRQIVETLDRDPLKLIRKKIDRVISGSLTYAPWEEIEDMNLFLGLKEKVLTEMTKSSGNTMVTGFEQIAHFALEYGIEIEEINLERTLVEKFAKIAITNVEVDTAKAVELKEHELNRLRKDLEEDLRLKERSVEQKEHFANAINTAFKVVAERISGGIEDIGELKQVLLESKDIQDMFQPNASISGPTQIGSGSQHAALLGAGEDKNLAGICYQLLVKIKAQNLDPISQKYLLSSIFHLIGIQITKFDDDDPGLFFERYESLELPAILKEQIADSLKEIKSCVAENNLL